MNKIIQVINIIKDESINVGDLYILEIENWPVIYKCTSIKNNFVTGFDRESGYYTTCFIDRVIKVKIDVSYE